MGVSCQFEQRKQFTANNSAVQAIVFIKGVTVVKKQFAQLPPINYGNSNTGLIIRTLAISEVVEVIIPASSDAWSIYGVLGPNGSKTTATIKMLLNLFTIGRRQHCAYFGQGCEQTTHRLYYRKLRLTDRAARHVRHLTGQRN